MTIKKTFIANLDKLDSNNDLNALSVITKEQAHLIYNHSKALLQQAENLERLLESFGVWQSWNDTKHVTFSDVVESNKLVKYNSSQELIERKEL